MRIAMPSMETAGVETIYKVNLAAQIADFNMSREVQ